MMDEVMLYNRALTPAEVKKLAEGVDSTTVLPVEPAGKLAKTWAGLKK
jgi:hypothetical protein